MQEEEGDAKVKEEDAKWWKERRLEGYEREGLEMLKELIGKEKRKNEEKVEVVGEYMRRMGDVDGMLVRMKQQEGEEEVEEMIRRIEVHEAACKNALALLHALHEQHALLDADVCKMHEHVQLLLQDAARSHLLREDADLRAAHAARNVASRTSSLQLHHQQLHDELAACASSMHQPYALWKQHAAGKSVYDCVSGENVGVESIPPKHFLCSEV